MLLNYKIDFNLVLTNDIINDIVKILLNEHRLPIQFLNKMLRYFKLDNCGTIINQELTKIQKVNLISQFFKYNYSLLI